MVSQTLFLPFWIPAVTVHQCEMFILPLEQNTLFVVHTEWIIFANLSPSHGLCLGCIFQPYYSLSLYCDLDGTLHLS